MSEYSYIIVPFDPDATGRLQPGEPTHSSAANEALDPAARCSSISAGIAVIAMPADDWAEPSLIATFGRVPAATLDIFGGMSKTPGSPPYVLRGERKTLPQRHMTRGYAGLTRVSAQHVRLVRSNASIA